MSLSRSMDTIYIAHVMKFVQHTSSMKAAKVRFLKQSLRSWKVPTLKAPSALL